MSRQARSATETRARVGSGGRDHMSATDTWPRRLLDATRFVAATSVAVEYLRRFLAADLVSAAGTGARAAWVSARVVPAPAGRATRGGVR
jgi:hypothetical protein